MFIPWATWANHDRATTPKPSPFESAINRVPNVEAAENDDAVFIDLSHLGTSSAEFFCDGKAGDGQRIAAAH